MVACFRGSVPIGSLHGSFSNLVCVCAFAEGSLEGKLLTIWTIGKAEVGRVREQKRRREKIREEKESERSIFPMICGSGGSKNTLAKAAGAEPCGQEKLKVASKHVIFGPLLEVAMSKKCAQL